jgi:hypothetical protein
MLRDLASAGLPVAYAVPTESLARNIVSLCLASGSPGTNAVRSLAQTTLVHKYYGALLPQGFFLSSGQRTRFQRRIAGSSRCVARPVGRWQLQPKERSIRHTWPG